MPLACSNPCAGRKKNLKKNPELYCDYTYHIPTEDMYKEQKKKMKSKEPNKKQYL